MKISEALEIANDIRNGCRNVGEASAIVTLADAIDVMSTAERNMLLGCERGEHKSCTVQFEDGTSLAFCELCGTHWPFDNAAKSKRAMWYASVVRTEVAKNIALIRSHESAPAFSSVDDAERWMLQEIRQHGGEQSHLTLDEFQKRLKPNEDFWIVDVHDRRR